MSRIFVLIGHDPLFALMAMRRRTVHPVVPTSKESGRYVKRRCCAVLNGTVRTTMSIIATRSNVRAVRIYLPVIRISPLRG